MNFSFFFFFPLSFPALWQQNCNLNTFYAKKICFAKGSFMNVKLPLMPINCPFIYFCYNISHVIMPNRTGGKGKRKSRRRNRTKIERKTRQPAATPVKTKLTTIHGLCGESSLSATRSTWKQTSREKTNTQTNKHTLR